MGFEYQALELNQYHRRQLYGQEHSQADDQSPNAVALGYQLGSLLLPMVMPLVVWLASHGTFLNQLALRTPPHDAPRH